MFKRYYKKQTVLPETVMLKFNTYKHLSKYYLDQYKWLGEDPDHSLEFTSLYYTATNFDSSIITLAEQPEGRFFRHPSKVGHSLEELHERATISRDMYTGMIWLLYTHKRLDILQRIIKYANKHYFKMGDYVTTEHPGTEDSIKQFLYNCLPVKVYNYFTNGITKLAKWLSKYEGVTRVYLNPGLYFTFKAIEAKLSNRMNPWLYIPNIYFKAQTGFRANLTALHIGLMGELRGYITESELTVLKSMIDLNPNNALFQAIYHKYLDGDQSKTIEILMRSDLFPNGRLPTSKDRSTYWLWSSLDTHSDWKPNPDQNFTHCGVDYLFVVKLICL